ncbi:amidohydrolase [Myxococcota bacterium]|nr:amidohydrolase [Myxococcota bacterium]
MGTVDVVDGDGHVVERASDLEAFGWKGTATPLIDTLLGWETREDWSKGLHPEVIDGAYDPPARLADMNREGIEVAINYPSALLGVSDFSEPAESTAACRAYNDWFSATYHAHAPERLRAMALVPLGAPEEAAKEARRAIVELGAVGVMVQPYTGENVHLCDATFDPLWATLQELGRPVAVHGSRHTCSPHLRAESFRNSARFYALSHPFQQMVAMGDFALGGVLERFPRLRVAFLESGIGWMPYYIDRLDEAYQSVREDWTDQRYELARPASETLLSGNCFFSCEPDEPHLSTMINALGENQVIFASDYPHFDCKFPSSAKLLLESDELSPALATRVAGTNARNLYGL